MVEEIDNFFTDYVYIYFCSLVFGWALQLTTTDCTGCEHNC